jgi:hypothetical protein
MVVAVMPDCKAVVANYRSALREGNSSPSRRSTDDSDSINLAAGSQISRHGNGA